MNDFFEVNLPKFFDTTKPVIVLDKDENGKEHMSTLPYQEACDLLTLVLSEFLIHGVHLGRDFIEDMLPVLKVWQKNENDIDELHYSSEEHEWKVAKKYYNLKTDPSLKPVTVSFEVQFPEVYHFVLIQEDGNNVFNLENISAHE